MTGMSVEQREAQYPSIRWREPQAITIVQWDREVTPMRCTGEIRGFVCRICVAEVGLKGWDTDRVFDTPEACREHIREEHA